MLNLKKLLTKILDHINPQQVGASGSVTVNAGQFYDICTVTLQPNSKYVVLADLGSNNATQHQCGLFIDITSGTPAENFGNGLSRLVGYAGNGISAWKYIRTGSTSVTVRLRCYGYYTTSHTETGHLFAWRIGGA